MYPTHSIVRSMNDLITLPSLCNATFKQKAWFRGQAKSDWQLQPSICRKYQRIAENAMAQQFRLRANFRYPACPAMEDSASWLSLMQHFGLPTRLLDWSESILIAAFFAIARDPEEFYNAVIAGSDAQNAFKQDIANSGSAAIWALAPGKLNSLGSGKNEIMQLTQAETLPLRNLAFNKELAEIDSTYAVTTNHIDIKMLLQQAAFTIHGSSLPLDDYPEANEFLMKFEIAQEFKLELSARLEEIGIRYSSIFPDLEHLAAELKTRIY